MAGESWADSQDDDEADQEVEQTWRSEPEQLNSVWQLAKALVIRGGQGAILKLSASQDKAWLPLEKIRSRPGRSEEELCDALRKPIKVRIDESCRHTGLPVASMWNVEDDEDPDGALRRWQQRKADRITRQRERKLEKLRRSFDPLEWLDGTVASVKHFGVFVDTVHEVRMMISVGYIPDTLLLDGAPNLDVGNVVQFRICGYRGKDHTGKDRFSCSMLPPPSKEEEDERPLKGKGKGKGKGKSKQKGTDRGRKGGGSGGDQTSGYSVWVPDRVLESESTLARQEKFEVNALQAAYLEEQYGHTDRRATLARKGFTVVDYATSLHLAQAIKPKTEAKAEVATTLKPTPVWLTFGSRRKLVGKIQTCPSMTGSERERLAVDLALEVANDAIQDGANVRKVDVDDDKILIRLAADGGLQF